MSSPSSGVRMPARYPALRNAVTILLVRFAQPHATEIIASTPKKLVWFCCLAAGQRDGWVGTAAGSLRMIVILFESQLIRHLVGVIHAEEN
jgi:hypothetical protein